VTTPRRQIVADILREFPHAPKQTLARLLAERHPAEFHNVDSARSAIRYYTGAFGDKSSPQSMIMDDKRKPSTLKIPKGDRRSRNAWVAPNGQWLVTGDWHIPYHQETAIEAMLQHAADNNIRNLYLNGDICDFYQASMWTRDPRLRNMQSEIDLLHEILDVLQPMFDTIAYKIGNHEYRLTRKLYSSVPELAVLRQFRIDKVLDLKSRGIDMIKDKQRAKFGGLSVWHGHELQKGLTVPVNIARGVWLRTNERGLCSHWHRTSTHVEVAGVGEHTYTCYSIGCMCDLSPDYAPVNKWNHGFAVVEVDGKSYQVANYVVDRGKVHAAG
jgi:hypothetical protein